MFVHNVELSMNVSLQFLKILLRALNESAYHVSFSNNCNYYKAFKDFFKRRLGIIRYVVIIYNYVRYFSKFQLLLIYMSFILYKIYNDWKLSF